QSPVRSRLRGGRRGEAGSRISDFRRWPRLDARSRRGRAQLARAEVGRGGAVKLGLLTAAFPDQSLEEVAQWASANGFEALEIACWPSSGSENRRYAGVAHIDVDDLNPKAVRKL